LSGDRLAGMESAPWIGNKTAIQTERDWPSGCVRVNAYLHLAVGHRACDLGYLSVDERIAIHRHIDHRHWLILIQILCQNRALPQGTGGQDASESQHEGDEVDSAHGGTLQM